MRVTRCRHCNALISCNATMHSKTSIPQEEYFCKSCNAPRFWVEVCENCNNVWNKNDKYCRYCGTLSKSPVFILNAFPAILDGPDGVIKVHTCTACKFTWENDLVFDAEGFCPHCGHPAPVVGKRRAGRAVNKG